VIDSVTLAPLVPPIDRIRGGGMSWLPDGSGLFHSRLAADYQTRPRAERFMDARVHFRALARPAEELTVFGPGVHASVSLDRSDSAHLTALPEHDLLLAQVQHGVKRELELWQSPLAATLAGRPAWERVYDSSAQIHEVAIARDALYLRSAAQAPRFKVLRLPLGAVRPGAAKGKPAPKLDLAHAETVLAQRDEVINDIAAAREGVYVTLRAGPVKSLARLPLGAKPALAPLALPVSGNVRIGDTDRHQGGAIVSLGGWTRATRPFEVDAAGRFTDLQLFPVGPYDAPDTMEAREARVKSHDGVEVPVSILLAKGTRLDGTSPLILYGYGAYGVVEEPSFNPRLLAWIERGGIFAVAHVRGGGVYGDDWRRAGWKSTKPNTWKDGIAVAQWLVDQGYTAPARLSIFGGSAGGIFVGRAITERPDLFASAVIAVGNVDSIRSESRANGAGNVPEYGTVRIEEEFKALLAMSPYANVKPGTAYPAVLLEHGVNDIRVDVWMAAKLASRLAASTTSGKPVLLRLDYDAGHGAGSTREQVQQQVADRWSFLLWQAGRAEFQPPAAKPPG
jgi:prolyl oligopeptidase